MLHHFTICFCFHPPEYHSSQTCHAPEDRITLKEVKQRCRELLKGQKDGTPALTGRDAVLATPEVGAQTPPLGGCTPATAPAGMEDTSTSESSLSSDDTGDEHTEHTEHTAASDRAQHLSAMLTHQTSPATTPAVQLPVVHSSSPHEGAEVSHQTELECLAEGDAGLVQKEEGEKEVKEEDEEEEFERLAEKFADLQVVDAGLVQQEEEKEKKEEEEKEEFERLAEKFADAGLVQKEEEENKEEEFKRLAENFADLQFADAGLVQEEEKNASE